MRQVTFTKVVASVFAIVGAFFIGILAAYWYDEGARVEIKIHHNGVGK